VPNFSDYVAQGNAWLFLPAAVLLGALHGLEPGHSKTMMAAFIIAIRGTVAQAVLLGLAATASHTALIWVLAWVGLHYSGKVTAEAAEPYLQAATGVIVMAMAAWMAWRVWRSQQPSKHGPHGGPVLRAADGFVEVSVFEDGVPPRFRLYFFDVSRRAVAPPAEGGVQCETIRPEQRAGGSGQVFRFKSADAYLEATEELPEPHEFDLKLTLTDGGQTTTHATQFVEEHGHDHAHSHSHGPGHGDDHAHSHSHGPGEPVAHEFHDEDEHSREHAREWQQRFAGRDVTTGQIILFGLTGGLLPCPSAFAVLLICLQLKQFALGFALVLAFSLGLALTLVTVGALAALSVRHATKHYQGFHTLAARLPYASAALMLVIGALVLAHGVKALMR